MSINVMHRRMRAAADLLDELAEVDVFTYGAGHTQRERQYRKIAKDLRQRIEDGKKAQQMNRGDHP